MHRRRQVDFSTLFIRHSQTALMVMAYVKYCLFVKYFCKWIECRTRENRLSKEPTVLWVINEFDLFNPRATKLSFATSATKGRFAPPRFSVWFKILYRALQRLQHYSIIMIQHCFLSKMVHLNVKCDRSGKSRIL